MSNSVNFQNEMEREISEILKKDARPRLLLHACCAPCSSYVLEYLAQYFDINLLYYNPNIIPQVEYEKRFFELQKLIEEMPLKNKVQIFSCKYENEKFIAIAKGLKDEPEGGERCHRCYKLRLFETAKVAKNNNFDYFTTTLSISPYKNAEKLNEIGYEAQDEFGIKYLCADFKKKNGYKRSIELSKEYNLYRQNYCGCTLPVNENKNSEGQ